MLYVKHPSKRQHREKIKELWKIAFGDEDDYIEFFLDNRAKAENTLILTDEINGEEKLASVLFLLDCETRIEEKLYKTAYLYAACTHPDYRNKGCMGTLLNAAQRQCSQKGFDFISLVPAEDSLFNYYSRFNYIDAFKERVFNLKRSDAEALALKNCEICDFDENDMLTIRASMLKNNDALIWDKAALKYAIDENAIGENEALAVMQDGICVGYAFFYKEDDKLIVRECAFRDDGFYCLLRAFLDTADFKNISIKIPAFMNFNARSRVRFNGMLLPLNKEAHANIKNINNAFLSHTLG